MVLLIVIISFFFASAVIAIPLYKAMNKQYALLSNIKVSDSCVSDISQDLKIPMYWQKAKAKKYANEQGSLLFLYRLLDMKVYVSTYIVMLIPLILVCVTNTSIRISIVYFLYLMVYKLIDVLLGYFLVPYRVSRISSRMSSFLEEDKLTAINVCLLRVNYLRCYESIANFFIATLLFVITLLM